MKTITQARSEHSARGNKRLRETGYNAMASTRRREATPPAKYAHGGKVGKSGAKTQVNIIVPHHGGPPGGMPGGGAPMPMAPHPAMPVAAPAGLGRPPMPPMGAPAPGGMPPGGPGPMKKGGRVKR